MREKDYTALKSSELAKSRSDLQIIFQDPYASLDPRMTIGDIIGEPLDIQLKLPTKRAYGASAEDYGTCRSEYAIREPLSA